MIYLLDANTLINANRTWYALNRVPEFWRWIVHHAEAGTVKMPSEIYAEVEAGTDELAAWMKDADHKKALRFAETRIWPMCRSCWRSMATRSAKLI